MNAPSTRSRMVRLSLTDQLLRGLGWVLGVAWWAVILVAALEAYRRWWP